MKNYQKLLLVHFFISISTSLSAEPVFKVEKDTNAEGAIVSVLLSHPGHIEVLGLYVNQDAEAQILGAWSFKSGQALFTPALPLEAARNYFVMYTQNDKVIRWYRVTGELRTKDSTPPTVVHIYPTSSTLPENLLRFYIEFSQPMREENFIEHISFTDKNGNELEGVFLPSRYEYWNLERTKITIIFDPGRVKTGLIAHQQYGGRALKAGKEYTLAIQAGWRAMNGNSLAETTTKTFEVTKEVMAPIDISDWKLEIPTANTHSPLMIRFDRPIDHINAQSFVTVVDRFNNPVEGSISISESETLWQFSPAKTWTPGEYQVVINKKLEDVCGNNLVHGFDVYKASELAASHHNSQYLISVNIK